MLKVKESPPRGSFLVGWDCVTPAGYREAMIAGILSEVASARTPELLAYVMGALRDGTFSRGHLTWRLAQRHVAWLEIVKEILARVGASWIYREGSRRSVWVLETCFRPDGLRPGLIELPSVDRAYARGYFDAEGGIPRDSKASFYGQLTQKNRDDLADLRRRFERLGLNCGPLHVPSASVDPDYRRFYVATRSHDRSFKRFPVGIPSSGACLSSDQIGPQSQLVAMPSDVGGVCGG